MSAIEETKNTNLAKDKPAANKDSNFLNGLLNLLSSVRFGIVLLIILGILSFLGMIIMQQNVDGFDKYYAELTPSEKLLYGSLGFFDIYHTWYYNLLILVLSLNIILASIERAPRTWRIVSNRKLEASKTWLLAQQHKAEKIIDSDNLKSASERVLKALRSYRLKTQALEKDGRVHIFAEKGWWNRLGYLAVHVALLTIFTGGFLTAQFSQDGMIPLEPGQSTNEMQQVAFNLDQIGQKTAKLPFTITCVDIQQKLIRKDGAIDASNTIDWLTKIRIKDETGLKEALVHLNEPVDYRGYRFFQASFIANGKARNIKLSLTPEKGGTPVEVSIPRDGSITLQDGTIINFTDFYSNFMVGQSGKLEEVGGADYAKPVAILEIVKPNSSGTEQALALFNAPDNIPIAKPVAGYKFKLLDFEKVPQAHTLSVNKDPGKIPFYLGGGMLCLVLIAVFFFSHQRVWALVEDIGDGKYAVVFGGNTNRNQLKFEDKFKELVNKV
jgi:cytochrome c biogenesis protein